MSDEIKAEVIEQTEKVDYTKGEKKEGDVLMSCRQPNCDSMVAREIKIPHTSTRAYQCCSCGHTRHINIGGGVNFL